MHREPRLRVNTIPRGDFTLYVVFLLQNKEPFNLDTTLMNILPAIYCQRTATFRRLFCVLCYRSYAVFSNTLILIGNAV